MLPSLFLAWTLVVQVQLSLCQDGVCQPYPTLQRKSQVVRTLATESECLLLQMDLQREYQRLAHAVANPPPPQRHVARKTTFVCQPSS